MLKMRGLKRSLPPPPPPPAPYVLAFEANDIVWTILLYLFFNNSFRELHGAHFGRVHRHFLPSPCTASVPRPSRSIHFGDVSETNERETDSLLRSDLVTRNALAG